MTGEITILGKILPVEGIHEKIVAAAEAGIKTVYLPAGNEKDVQMLPPDQELIAAKFKELEPIRNAVRHGRKLTIEQREKLKVSSRDIIRQILASEIQK